MKGLDAPVEVHEIVGAAARSRFQALAARGLTRFVGRDAEPDQIPQALEQAATGRGQPTFPLGGVPWFHGCSNL